MFTFKNRKNYLLSPVNGECIDLSNVNDPVFSQHLMGEGAAIIPSDGMICSPCSGKITLIADTLHAFGIVTDEGMEILVHIGIDTVNLKREGFTSFSKIDATVKPRDPIISVDLKLLEEKNIDPTILIIILNHNDFNIKNIKVTGLATMNETKIIEY
ncbi:MAG: PTS glucose transporter subunit IIA [Erysipelotrichaceae bacterium]